MANYCCTVRTNYFHVKNEDDFRSKMSCILGCEDSIELWEKTDEDGKSIFGFGVYGGILGFSDSSSDEFDEVKACEDFIKYLQESVSDDDAVIILESGNEKMCYVVGSATVITSSEIKTINITDLAIEKARDILNNPLWKTRCEY